MVAVLEADRRRRKQKGHHKDGDKWPKKIAAQHSLSVARFWGEESEIAPSPMQNAPVLPASVRAKITKAEKFAGPVHGPGKRGLHACMLHDSAAKGPS